MNRSFLSWPLTVTIVLAGFFLSAFPLNQSLAQGLPLSGGSMDLSTSVDNPSPGQTVTVTAKSYSIDISAATITWTVDGKTVLKGIGEDSLSVSAPALGKTLKVTATAVAPNGVIITTSIGLSSGSVDMIVENDGYVPPMFKGKTPVSYQNTVRIIAVPHLADSKGVEYDPATLVYRWQKNGQAVEDQSGYGKQSLTVQGSIVPRAFTVTVTVSTRDNSAQTAGFASVAYDDPSISFYVDDPLYGPFFNKAINDLVRIGSEKETGVLAVPFGFNKPSSGLGDLALTWSINGQEYPDLASNQSIILRAPDNSQGTANIALSVRNQRQILQGADAGFSTVFVSGPAGGTDNIVNY